MDVKMSRARLSFWSVYAACVILVLWHVQALTLMSMPLGQSLSMIEGVVIFIVVGYAAERTVLPVGRKATQDLAATVHIAALLLFPAPFPMVIALLAALAASVRRGEGSRARRIALTFRPASVVGLSSGVMSSIHPAASLLKNGYSEMTLPLLGLLVLTYIVFDNASIIVELIVRGQDKPLRIWLRIARRALLPELTAAATGLLVAIVWHDDTLLVTLFVAPVFALYVALNAIGAEHTNAMLRRRGEQLETVVAVGQRLRVQHAPPDLLRPVAEAARDLFAAPLVGAYLRDADAPTTLRRVVATPADVDPGPLLVPAALAESGFQERGYGRDRVVIVPIDGENGVVGVLRLAGVVSSIEHDDRDALAVLANQAAIALQNMRLHEWALARASEDGLTALLNHRAFQMRLESEAARALRGGHALSLLMVDLDDFRTVNNTYGHQVGDRALAAVAAALRSQMRGADVAARYGGDEFAVILPETPFEDAFAVGRRIQMSIAALVLDVGTATVRIGSSIGVAALPHHARTREDLIKAADRAAYAAKHSGKGRVATPEDAEQATALEEAGVVALATELEHANLATVEALATAVDAKDSYTRGHSQRVSLYAEAVARALGIAAPDVARVRLAGLLHDVGKIGVPDAILTKFDALTDEEFAILQRHPAVGESMLATAPFLHDILPAVRHHHERWDGKGYPDGLAGARIPLDARILMLADSLDAMTSSRTYRPAFSFNEARARIHEASGTQFDARVVEAFERAIASGLLRLVSLDATRMLSPHVVDDDRRAAG